MPVVLDGSGQGRLSVSVPMDQGYITWARSWGASPATISTRTTILRRYLTLHPDDWDRPDVIAQWIGQEHLSQWSRCTYLSALRSYCDWLMRTGQRTDDPTAGVKRPRSPRPRPRPFSDDEVELILQSRPHNPDVTAWLALGVLAGLRAHEVAKLRGEDVGQEMIYVEGKGGSVAFVPTHPRLWSIAQEYPRAGWWFRSPRSDTHISRNWISTCTREHLKSLGIEGSMHRARHTFGTTLLRNGANLRVVQELMRHASITSTQGYTLVSDDERASAIHTLMA